tara:strand:+ start:288 stop:443 length:156 start_codon:yes stop_codon:yes gene_type:complete
MIRFIFYFGFGVAIVNLFGLLFMSGDSATLIFHLTYLIAGILICAVTYKNL